MFVEEVPHLRVEFVVEILDLEARAALAGDRKGH
jgi:hypothetical protein